MRHEVVDPHPKLAVDGYPKGFYLLFVTEVWERLSYYGTRVLLVLYMVDKTRGGLGWEPKRAVQLYGLWSGLTYLTPLAGGFLADRYLGQRRAIYLGCGLMMVGHFMMVLPGVAAFYAALALVLLGNGLSRANLTTMVGQIFDSGDPRRDSAFTLFYVALNLGYVAASLVCGTLGQRVGWHWGFTTAGLSMGLGLLIFWTGQKTLLAGVPLISHEQVAASPVAADPRCRTRTVLTRPERDRLAALGTLLLFSVVFWLIYDQFDGYVMLYLDQRIERRTFGWEVPTTWFVAILPVTILFTGPVLAKVWLRLARAGREPSGSVKFALAFGLLSLGFVFLLGAAWQGATRQKAPMAWIVVFQILRAVADLCISSTGIAIATKLVPRQHASLATGVWCVTLFVGKSFAGFLGGFARDFGAVQFFGLLAVVTAAAGATLLAIARPVHRMMHDAFPTAVAKRPEAPTGQAPVPHGSVHTRL